MRLSFLPLFTVLVCLTSGVSAAPVVQVDTSAGSFKLQLDSDKAPETVKNFLGYVEDGSYVGTIFHRVIAGFMIQGGGHLPDMTEVAEKGTIRNEADNGLKNTVGTIAMARMQEIDSAGRQFFINVEQNDYLDHSEQSCTREDEKAWLEAQEKGLRKPLLCKSFGYAVFGRVVEGMDVVHTIELVETGRVGDYDDVPRSPVVITGMTRVSE